MWLVNSGNKDVFLGGGSRLPPGEKVNLRKDKAVLLLRNPNISEVESGPVTKTKTAKRTNR